MVGRVTMGGWEENLWEGRDYCHTRRRVFDDAQQEMYKWIQSCFRGGACRDDHPLWTCPEWASKGQSVCWVCRREQVY